VTALTRLLELTATGSTGIAIEHHEQYSDPDMHFSVAVWRRLASSQWIRACGLGPTLEQAADDCEVRARTAGFFGGVQ